MSRELSRARTTLWQCKNGLGTYEPVLKPRKGRHGIVNFVLVVDERHARDVIWPLRGGYFC